MSLAGTWLAGRRLPVSDVDAALIAEGLRMVSDRIAAAISAAAERGERSTTHEALLAIISGGEGSKGLLARVLNDREPLRIFDPSWEPITPE